MGQHMQAATAVIPMFGQQKRVNPMEIAESSYQRLNRCFLAIASFHKAY